MGRSSNSNDPCKLSEQMVLPDFSVKEEFRGTAYGATGIIIAAATKIQDAVATDGIDHTAC